MTSSIRANALPTPEEHALRIDGWKECRLKDALPTAQPNAVLNDRPTYARNSRALDGVGSEADTPEMDGTVADVLLEPTAKGVLTDAAAVRCLGATVRLWARSTLRRRRLARAIRASRDADAYQPMNWQP